MSFSVIIPTHDRSSIVVRAVDSVLAADTGEPLDVIVVDDASTDGTVETLDARYRDEPRVRVVRLERNEGPSGARNAGLAAARGDYVVFLDSDDVLLPDALRLAYAAFGAAPDLQFVTLEGDACPIDRPDDVRHHVVRNNPGWNRGGFEADRFEALAIRARANGVAHTLRIGDCSPAILFGDLFYLSGLAIRRPAACAAAPFNPRFRYLEDWEFAARLCLLGPGGYVDAPGFLRQLSRGDQLSRLASPWRLATMHHQVLQGVRGFEGARPSPRTLARAQAAADYWLGRCLQERHHPRAARAYLLCSMRRLHQPLKSLVRLAQGSIEAWRAPDDQAVAARRWSTLRHR
ncbi:glycosyltransferase family 2 protein [Dokdonella sp.]|uniref:glycosyltransferase family 2 protein n=1 Tax=Dokdonella sp. TaxID=2291710 RepID=UPI002F409C12